MGHVGWFMYVTDELCACGQDALKCNGTSESAVDGTDPFDSEVNDGGVVLRKRFKRRSVNRLSVINGHCYNREVTIPHFCNHF